MPYLRRLLVVVALVAAACSSGADSEGETAPTTLADTTTSEADPATTTATTGPPAPSALELDWTAVAVPLGVSDIEAFGAALVGLARETVHYDPAQYEEQIPDLPSDSNCLEAPGRTGQVMTSTDGVTWEPLTSQPRWYTGPIDQPVELPDVNRTGAPIALLVHDDRLFAVTFLFGQDEVVVERWSTDSETWELVPGADAPLRPRGNVVAAAGPNGLVIVGQDDSSQLQSWVLEGDQMVAVNDPVLAAAATDDVLLVTGSLVAAQNGFVLQLDAMLVSEDGLAWSEVADPPTETPFDMAWRDGQLLGAADHLWVSTDDGRTWDRHPSAQGIGGGHHLVSGPAGWAATLGGFGLLLPDGIVFSSSGETWDQVLDLEQTNVTGIAVTDEAILVVTSRVPDEVPWGPCALDGQTMSDTYEVLTATVSDDAAAS